MKLVAFNFNKILIERLQKSLEKVELKSDVSLKDIKEFTPISPPNTKDSFFEVTFLHKIDYSPEVAILELGGKLIFSSDNEEIKDILKDWKKKQLKEDFKIAIFNFIIRKTTPKAIQLEEEFNLPLHIPLPSFKKKEEK